MSQELYQELKIELDNNVNEQTRKRVAKASAVVIKYELDPAIRNNPPQG